MIKNNLTSKFIKVSRRVFLKFCTTLHVFERSFPAVFLPQYSVAPFHKLTAVRFSSARLLGSSSVAPFHALDVAAVIHCYFVFVPNVF